MTDQALGQDKFIGDARNILAAARADVIKILLDSDSKIQDLLSHGEVAHSTRTVPGHKLPKLNATSMNHERSSRAAAAACRPDQIVPEPSAVPAWKPPESTPRSTDTEKKRILEQAGTKENKRKLADILGVHIDLGFAERIEKHPAFDIVCSLFIVVGSICVGIQTQQIAHDTAKMAEKGKIDNLVYSEYLVVQGIITLLFLFEISIRWVSSGLHGYFKWKVVGWNVFDLCVMFSMVIDLIFEITVAGDGGESPVKSLAALRILRVIRLVRSLRVIRIFRFFRDLRMMLISIMSCFKSLLWVMIIMILVIYVFGIGFTTAALSYLETPELWKSKDSADLIVFFGTLGNSMLSLFQAMTGGNDWGGFYDALGLVGAFWQIQFLIYISFSLFAVINIVTGVFVESAVELANNDREARIHEQLQLKILMEKELKEMFDLMDHDNSGNIQKWEFEMFLESDYALAIFRDLDIQADEAMRLYDILDSNKSGFIQADEFVAGCMDMQGGGSAYNQMIMMKEIKDIKSVVVSVMGPPPTKSTRACQAH